MDIEQKKSASSEEIVSYIREQLESRRDASQQRTADARSRAEEQEHRYQEARGELEATRQRLREMRPEYESLPLRSHTEAMRGNKEEQKKLDQRFRELESQIEADVKAVQSLAAELDHLAPGSRRLDPENGASLSARTPVNRVAQAEREELEELHEELTSVIEETLQPIYDEAERIQHHVSGLSTRIESAWRSSGYSNAAQVPSHGSEEG